MVTLSSCLIWQIIRFILPNEYGCVYAWTTLGNIATDRLTEDADFGEKKIIFSDEAHFDLGGYVNKQNCRIWGTENPHAYSTHPKRVTVWCGFWSKSTIAPFFFENEQEEAVQVKGDRYRAMLKEFLFTKIEEQDIGNIWFQQNGARCHTAEATLDVLRSVFENYHSCRELTSRQARDNWRFKGQYSYKCYKPETIDILKDNIHEATGEIQLHTIDNVLKNCTDRVATAWSAEAANWMKLFSIINRKDCTLK